jgi:hypothetical protein
MKTIKLLIITGIFLTASSAKAQVSVNVNIGTPTVNVNVGTPPVWGPVGNDNVEYYYLPDIEVYYDIRASQYIYFGNGHWIRVGKLPKHCRNYDLYHGYKVVLTDYHGHSPYTHFHSHKKKYYKGYKGKPQKCRGNNGNHYGNSNNKHDDDHDDHHDKHEEKEKGKGHKEKH